MSGAAVAISLGSNLGDRRLNLRRALSLLGGAVRVVRVSSLYETEPIDAPPGSPRFLNAVVAGVTSRSPGSLLEFLLSAERTLGRRRGLRNEPRIIDIDLVLYDCRLLRSDRLVIPHPRYRSRNFVLEPLNELALGWIDPSTGRALAQLRGSGETRRVGGFY